MKVMKVKKKHILTPILIILLLLAIIVVYNIIVNRSFVTTFYQVTTEKNVNGLRIVELVDLHMHEYGENNDELVEKIEKLKPDVIAIAGDMVNYYDPDHSVALDIVKRLTAIAPVYYSAGNHEVETILRDKDSTLVQDIKDAGATYLSSEYCEVSVGSNKFLIAGVCKNATDIVKSDAAQNMLKKFCAEDEDEFKVFLCHFPEVFDSAMEGYPVDLALCGHAHGGLIRIPGTDGLYAPDQGFFPKYTSGVRNLCGSTVVISRGLGTSHKYELRINNRPELVVIDVN